MIEDEHDVELHSVLSLGQVDIQLDLEFSSDRNLSRQNRDEDHVNASSKRQQRQHSPYELGRHQSQNVPS